MKSSQEREVMQSVVAESVDTKARFPLPELMARVDGRPVSITRQHGPCWLARVSTSRVDGPSSLHKLILQTWKNGTAKLTEDNIPGQHHPSYVLPSLFFMKYPSCALASRYTEYESSRFMCGSMMVTILRPFADMFFSISTESGNLCGSHVK